MCTYPLCGLKWTCHLFFLSVIPWVDRRSHTASSVLAPRPRHLIHERSFVVRRMVMSGQQRAPHLRSLLLRQLHPAVPRRVGLGGPSAGLLCVCIGEHQKVPQMVQDLLSCLFWGIMLTYYAQKLVPQRQWTTCTPDSRTSVGFSSLTPL